MIGACALLATVVVIVAASIFAGMIGALSGLPEALLLPALIIGLAAHLALWVGSFHLLCRITHAR